MIAQFPSSGLVPRDEHLLLGPGVVPQPFVVSLKKSRNNIGILGCHLSLHALVTHAHLGSCSSNFLVSRAMDLSYGSQQVSR